MTLMDLFVALVVKVDVCRNKWYIGWINAPTRRVLVVRKALKRYVQTDRTERSSVCLSSQESFQLDLLNSLNGQYPQKTHTHSREAPIPICCLGETFLLCVVEVSGTVLRMVRYSSFGIPSFDAVPPNHGSSPYRSTKGCSRSSQC
jgi:hypothetical protein